MAILIVMAIAVVVVIAMTLKLNQEVRNLAEDVEIDRQNLAKLNHEVGKRLGAPRVLAGSSGRRGRRAPAGAASGCCSAGGAHCGQSRHDSRARERRGRFTRLCSGHACRGRSRIRSRKLPRSGSWRRGPSAAAAPARETARAEAAQSPRAAQTMPRQSTLAERRAERRGSCGAPRRHGGLHSGARRAPSEHRRPSRRGKGFLAWRDRAAVACAHSSGRSERDLSPGISLCS